MGNGLYLGGRSHRLIGSETTLGIDKMSSKNSVNQGRLPKTSLSYSKVRTIAQASKEARSIAKHTDTDNIELETAFKQLSLDLRGDTVETDMATGEYGCSLRHNCCWESMKIGCGNGTRSKGVERRQGGGARWMVLPQFNAS